MGYYVSFNKISIYIIFLCMSIVGEEDTFEAEGLDFISEESDLVFDTGVGEWLHSCA